MYDLRSPFHFLEQIMNSPSRTSRRQFLQCGAGVCIAGGVIGPMAGLQESPPDKPLPPTVAADEDADATLKRIRERNVPALEQRANEYVVLFAHSDIDKVRELVVAQPKLANATMDWGGGDWESALGAASHMGRRDIAELLLSHGARPDIFCAAMMGWLDAVKGMLSVQPALIETTGPHGIPLINHAKRGGTHAEGVVAYLESLNDS